MNIQHTTLPLAGLILHRIDFAPDTFQEADLLWLPHHNKLTHAGKKRKAEHLAGRVAAFHALRAQGISHIPDIGENRQPLWPAGWHGSISHCGSTAIAVVSQQAVGIDLENIFTKTLSDELVESLVSSTEHRALVTSGLPFPLALTLAFSAKESVFKAALNEHAGFSDIKIASINSDKILANIRFCSNPSLPKSFFEIKWIKNNNQITTLAFVI